MGFSDWLKRLLGICNVTRNWSPSAVNVTVSLTEVSINGVAIGEEFSRVSFLGPGKEQFSWMVGIYGYEYPQFGLWIQGMESRLSGINVWFVDSEDVAKEFPRRSLEIDGTIRSIDVDSKPDQIIEWMGPPVEKDEDELGVCLTYRKGSAVLEFLWDREEGRQILSSIDISQDDDRDHAVAAGE